MTHRSWFWIIVITVPLIALLIAFLGWYRYGSLVVLPEPKTANVYINGREAGFSSRLSPGSHEITVSAPGYLPHRETVTIKTLQIKRLRPALRKLAQAKLVAEGVDFLTADAQANQFFYLSRQARTFFRLRLVKGPPSRDSASVATPAKEAAPAGQSKIENIPITPSALGDLTEVAFAPDFSVAVVKERNGSSGLYNFARYDLLHQEFKPYDKDSSSFVFDPEGRLVYHLYRPGTERSLVRSERSRERIERLVNLKELGIENATLSFSPSGETLLMTDGKDAYLIVVTTKRVTKVADRVSSAVFIDDRKLLTTRQGELEILPFEIATIPTKRGQEGTVQAGSPTKLGLKGEATDLALSSDRLIGLFEPLYPAGGGARGKQFGSFELKTQRFLPLELAADLPEGAHNFSIDAANRNVLFIAQGKLWWIEL